MDLIGKSYHSLIKKFIFKDEYDYIKSYIDGDYDVNIIPSEYSEPILFRAIYKQNIKIINLLIESGANVNFKKLIIGTTPIHVAIETNNLNIIKILVKAGADIEYSKGYNNVSPLCLAINQRNLKIVKLLGESGVNINSKCSRIYESPLILACDINHCGIAKYLLRKGANPNIKGTYKKITPVFIASNNNNHKLIKHIFLFKPNPNETDYYGFTILMKILIKNKPDKDLIKFLCLNKVDVYKICKIDYNIKMNAIIYCMNYRYNNILAIFIMYGNAKFTDIYDNYIDRVEVFLEFDKLRQYECIKQHNVFQKELIEKTWHPKRLLNWCLCVENIEDY
jgi:ankyrin repeat protein